MKTNTLRPSRKGFLMAILAAAVSAASFVGCASAPVTPEDEAAIAKAERLTDRFEGRLPSLELAGE